jgi:hypothetical protein
MDRERENPDPELEPDCSLYDYAKEPRKQKQTKVLCNVFYNGPKQHNYYCREKKFDLPAGKSKKSLPNIHNPDGKRIPDGKSVYVRTMPRKFTQNCKAQREKKHMKDTQRDFRELCA